MLYKGSRSQRSLLDLIVSLETQCCAKLQSNLVCLFARTVCTGPLKTSTDNVTAVILAQVLCTFIQGFTKGTCEVCVVEPEGHKCLVT